MTTQQQYQFKGTYIEQIQRWVRSELGEDAWPRYFGSEGGVWTHGVLPNAWYDAEVVDRALRTLTKDHGLDY